ncbi:uncharacterized protein BHQ10_006339 [Talaromyces amestolkiae]|uniref:Ubiquitin-like domain-containing protein n=1 Tax=Talaromyces amestolkiae TaxID=1196081 RepID=A0A364L3D7_TALAM|nr:uncharacterized protein BHQ10_006339 [Talaromyces amestolkiae]RAO70327.1 hypothetical protein BHQ10_006339 [Talaromyces amestolkiae]
MRSFFNKPAWAKTDDEPSAPEFYRRSHQTYKDILKANREQRREEAAKSALKPVVESTRVPVRSSKRRRISGQDDESIKDASETDENKSDASSPPVEQSAKNNKTKHVESRENSQDIDEVALENELAVAEKQRTPSPGVQVVEEPPRFQESLSRHRPTLSPEKARSSSSCQDGVLANAGNAKAANGTQEDADRKVEMKAEVVVEILVTSEIENTKPLIVRRHMSQRFRDIRLTCLEISSSSSLSDDLDFEEGGSRDVLRIHVEAVTDEFLKARAEAEELASAPSAPSQTADSEAFHIVLKSPGYGDLRVKVLPRTPVQQIITNFRSKRNISPGSQVLLSFDGDVLDPDSQLKDYDIDDMDLVEVILR